MFVNTLSLTKGMCKKIAFDSSGTWDPILCPPPTALGPGTRPSARPLPVRGPVSDLAVHPVCSGGLCGWMCSVSHTPHIRDFIPLSHGKEKQRLLGSQLFSCKYLKMYTYARLCDVFLKFLF